MTTAYDFLFRADLFKAAMRCMRTEKTRYCFDGVAVQPHPQRGVYLVASDGHRMAVLHDEHGYASRPAIFRPTLKPAEYKPGKREGDLFITGRFKNNSAYGLEESTLREYPGDERNPTAIEYDPSTIDPDSDGWRATARKLNVLEEIDGSFFDWTRVLPACWGAESYPVLLNSRYVSGILEMLKDMERSAERAKRAGYITSRYPCVRISGNQERKGHTVDSGPCLIQFPDAPFCIVVLMPVCDDKPENIRRPDWLAGPKLDVHESSETVAAE